MKIENRTLIPIAIGIMILKIFADVLIMIYHKDHDDPCLCRQAGVF